MQISDILEVKGRDVHTVLPWATLTDAVRRLDEHRVGALLVCDATGRIRGIVSERDVVKGLRRHGPALLGLTVDAVMTTAVMTCRSNDGIREVMARMTRGRYRHLPVVDDGQLVGIVSIGDLVKHRLKEMELETGVLRDAVIARY
jgi:CBS domain-containing protein